MGPDPGSFGGHPYSPTERTLGYGTDHDPRHSTGQQKTSGYVDIDGKPQITGYRELDDNEVALINEAKDLAAEVGDLVDSLTRNPNGLDIDQRWVAIAKTQLQQGFMALVRSIAQPTTF